jgi:hypothetical protein
MFLYNFLAITKFYQTTTYSHSSLLFATVEVDKKTAPESKQSQSQWWAGQTRSTLPPATVINAKSSFT